MGLLEKGLYTAEYGWVILEKGRYNAECAWVILEKGRYTAECAWVILAFECFPLSTELSIRPFLLF